MPGRNAYRHAPLRPRPVAREDLPDQAQALLAQGARLALAACHHDPAQLRAVYTFTGPAPHQVEEITVAVPAADPWIPSLASISYPAGNFEREMRDLYGLRPLGHPQPYRLVRHGHWPRGWYPMRHDAAPAPEFGPDTESFPFLQVEGPGVYEVAVGPIHAGIIDPGHFRFSVVGETIIRLEARQWFMHRGMEKLFEGRRPAAGTELAEAIAGDTAVGHTLAYAMAVEDALAIEIPEPDRLRRALLLELERLYNHVTDLGALANDAGLGVINAHAGQLREQLLRLNKETTGHRLLRGAVTVGGTRLQALPAPAALTGLADAVQELADLTLGHSIVRDRFTGTACLPPDKALALGTLGYTARACGIPTDARREHPFADLGQEFTPVTEPDGDVRARYLVRAREFAASARIAAQLAEQLTGAAAPGPTPATQGPAPATQGPAPAGLGIVEGWRGTICHRVELNPDGTLARVKIVDPSFLNWPALPVALGDTIVPDFPLANKSFNLSYAGNDL